MKEKHFEKLFAEGMLSKESFDRVKEFESPLLFSIGFELKSILYVGVLLLATGLGIAIYNNIDSIGHMVIIALIATVSFGSFYYSYKKALPYSNVKVQHPSMMFDYVLLLAGLTLVSFTGYLQFQYSVFGSLNGLTFLIPAIFLFAAAYYFDHLAILSIAITCFAAFAGLSVTPLSILKSGNFSSGFVLFTGTSVGVILLLAGWNLSLRNIKRHFTATYFNFGGHLLFIFTLAGLFEYSNILFIALLIIALIISFRYSIKSRSFYFMLIAILYGYIGVTFLIFKFLLFMDLEVIAIYGGFLYLIFSGIYLLNYLRDYRRKLAQYDSI